MNRFVIALSPLLATTVVAMPVYAATPSVPLRAGTYIQTDTPCGRASNSVVMWFDGSSFSGGRMPNVTPQPTRVRGRYTGQAMDFRDNVPFTVTITILSREAFTWLNPWSQIRYRYCPDATVPPAWRGRR